MNWFLHVWETSVSDDVSLFGGKVQISRHKISGRLNIQIGY